MKRDGELAKIFLFRLPEASSADLYQVVVHVDEEALTRGADETASGVSSSEMPIDTVRTHGSDGSIFPIIESARVEPLNAGRKVRTITTEIINLVRD